MLLIVVALLVIGGVSYYLFNSGFLGFLSGNQQATVVDTTEPQEGDTATSTPGETIIGSSTEGRNIVAHHYGAGDKEILFVGGIHGGYEWNTVLVAYELMDYLEAQPQSIPANVRVTVVPVLNPDGLYKTVGSADRFEKEDAPATEEAVVPGRYNAHNVDLNRNFDCNWQPVAAWRNKEVKAGSAPFSEPESLAMKNYVEANTPDAVVVWYSSANGVFASSCDGDILEETSILTDLYSKASGYPAYEEYDYYEITGDMTNWLAKEGYPAISVLLSNHEDVEWAKNKAGVEALFSHYAN